MNINESVTIKLNETGMSILRAEHAELKSAFPSLPDFVEIEPDNHGFYPKKMQLWSVMQTFGPRISLGSIPPFCADIETHESDDVGKLKAMNKELLAALEAVANCCRGSSGRIILDEFDEQCLTSAIAKAKATS